MHKFVLPFCSNTDDVHLVSADGKNPPRLLLLDAQGQRQAGDQARGLRPGGLRDRFYKKKLFRQKKFGQIFILKFWTNDPA
jgi:hypothetical protein